MEAASRWLSVRAGTQELGVTKSRNEWSPQMIGWIDTQGHGKRENIGRSVSKVFMGSSLSQNALSCENYRICSHHFDLTHSPVTSLHHVTCLCQ